MICCLHTIGYTFVIPTSKWLIACTAQTLSTLSCQVGSGNQTNFQVRLRFRDMADVWINAGNVKTILAVINMIGNIAHCLF